MRLDKGKKIMETLSLISQDPSVADSIFMTENIWIMISAMLVFIMSLGFACVESGL